MAEEQMHITPSTLLARSLTPLSLLSCNKTGIILEGRILGSSYSRYARVAI
jgi:hypothetical protein